MRQLFAFSFLVIFGFVLKAQQNYADTLPIKEITIVSNRLPNFVVGNRLESIDSLNKEIFENENLADILENTSSISIKSYGVSGIASASVRGTNANHIAVLWNGFNIQDALTAGLGLSLIPNTFIDDISVQYGGSSSLFGSGAIGGVIHLNNKADFNKGFKLTFSSSYGSFNRYFAALNISFSDKNFNARLKTFYRSEENDFPFINTSKYGHPEEINQNSALESMGLLQENFIRFSDYSLLSTHYWYQSSFREVAANMTTSAGSAWQEDLQHKAAVKYYKNINNIDFYFKSGVFYNQVHYVNNEMFIDATHSSVQWITELESKINFRRNDLLNIGVNNSYTQGKSESFLNDESLNNFAFYLSYKYINKSEKIVVVSSLREEYFNNAFIEPNFSLGGNFFLSKKIEGKLNVSKNFRAPTFNDLYWVDGFARGNPDLHPEKAYSSEIGVVYHPFNSKQVLNIELTTFANYIKNLILWQPIDNIWTPVNLKENFARGVELNLSTLFSVKAVVFNYKLSYSYTKSSIEKISENESEDILHNQISYVPYHNVNSNLSARYKGFSVSCFHNFVGKRYADISNSRTLDAYLLSNLSASYKFHISDVQINTFFKINNMWNVDYQTVYLYPNPLRNYELGLKIKL